jgi:hypothetical protein
MAKNVALIVQTARIGSVDPDRFDITRKSGGAEGRVFAPSWAILEPALLARKQAARLPDLDGDVLLDEAFRDYAPRYVAEMRVSYRQHRPAWDRLLTRTRVVLICYCTDANRCHRHLLAEILTSFGARNRGELDGASSKRSPSASRG